MATHEVPGLWDSLTVGLFRVAIELEDAVRKCHVLAEEIEATRPKREPRDG